MKENLKEGNLHKWFKGSKSKDGKGGWVNVVTGGTCASDEPGEGTPKCVSSSKRASMSKSERLSAARRKKKADPNQQQKSGAAKPTYVPTDKPKKKNEEFDMEIQESDKKGKGSGKKDACYHKVKASASVWPSAYASGRLVQCRKKGAANYGNSKKNEEFMALPEFSEIQINSMRAAGIEVEVLDEKCWKGYEKKGMKTMFGKRYPNCVKKEEVEVSEEKKDKGVKGIAKELDKAVEMHKGQAKRLRAAGVSEGKVDGDPCWDTHKQVGMKKKGGKMVPNCVPKNEEVQVSERQRVLEALRSESVELEDADGKKFAEVIDVVTNEDLGITMSEAARIPQQYGNIYLVGFNWKSRYMMMRLFFPEVKKPSRKEVQEALDKIYPGCVVQRFDIVPYKPGEPMLNMGVKEETEQLDEKSAAWQRKEGKNKTGGLNEKGRKSYERENPGSDLKAPQPEGGPRKRSFCARMGGVKGPMKKPDGSPTRKALALRKWKC